MKMGVYKRPECEWKGGKPTWYFQFTRDKVKHYGGIFKTQREARDAEQAKLNELKSKRAVPIPRAKATFSEAFPKFIEERRRTKSPTTVGAESRRGKALCSRFGGKRRAAVTVVDIDDYVGMRQEAGCAPRSINLEITLLRSLFKFAVKHGYAEFNPAREVDSLPEVRTEKWIPSRAELQQFVDCAARTPTGRFIVPWIWFRAYTGTRPTESVYVEWDDIDFENDRIHVRPKNGNELKNRKFRVVEMHDELKPILLAWRDDWQEIHDRWWRRENAESRRKKRGLLSDHQWVFINPRRHGERANGYHKAFYKAREEAGLPQMTSHTLRHYFISHCVMSGIDFFTIAKWVGHANTRMIEEVYGHLSPAYRKKQMAKLRVI